MKNRSFLSVLLLLPLLFLVPSCKWLGKGGGECPSCVKPGVYEEASADDGKAVVSIDGKKIATIGDIKEAFNAIRCQQPMFDQIFNMMPDAQKELVYRQILDSFADQAVLEGHVRSMKWDRSDCYRKVAEQMHKMLDRQLAVNEFRKRTIEEIAAQMSDKEAEEFFNKNREQRFHQAPFLLSPGGNQAVAVTVETEAAAKALLAKARAMRDLRVVAREAKLQVMDMGTVSSQSSMQYNFELVGKVLAAKTFPEFDMTSSSDKGGKKTFYVYEVTRKVEPQYAEYAQVSAKVKELMASERFPQEYTKRLADLKAKHKIEISEEYIKSRVGTTTATQPEAKAA
ncbi:MAG: hypothetical protein M1549_01730 [Candidatus Dependentiae bacterium]|nr:hypothetical protein [Candidatus Dependentiae bacterium]